MVGVGYSVRGLMLPVPSCAMLLCSSFKAFCKTKEMRKGRVKSCGLSLTVLVFLVVHISNVKQKFEFRVAGPFVLNQDILDCQAPD